ncbi:phytoene/squalene synthase family protein [bacterium]|jgi:15-cis-phytoene synthase|nr:phytoene/squalene synthase family protein [bacterium]
MTLAVNEHELRSRTIDDTRHCEEIIARHSKSFALASRLLTKEVRSAAVATYAWCRRADDAVDHATDRAQAEDRLARLRHELDDLDAGRESSDPVLRAIGVVMRERGLPSCYLRELLAGMEMDVQSTRYETLADLMLYCHRVAGVVGLMMCHVLGVSSDDALPHAARLGIAMQLTNICRDVDEDWRRGRCYLPASMLSSRARTILQGPALPTVPQDIRLDLAEPVRTLLAEADRHYRAGDAGLCYLDRVSGWAIQTARLAYSGIGDVLARRGYDVGQGRAVVSGTRKRWLAMSALWSSIQRTHPSSRMLHVPTRILEYRLWND